MEKGQRFSSKFKSRLKESETGDNVAEIWFSPSCEEQKEEQNLRELAAWYVQKHPRTHQGTEEGYTEIMSVRASDGACKI